MINGFSKPFCLILTTKKSQIVLKITKSYKLIAQMFPSLSLYNFLERRVGHDNEEDDDHHSWCDSLLDHNVPNLIDL